MPIVAVCALTAYASVAVCYCLVGFLIEGPSWWIVAQALLWPLLLLAVVGHYLLEVAR